MHVWRSENSLWEIILSFHYVGSTQLNSLSGLEANAFAPGAISQFLSISLYIAVLYLFDSVFTDYLLVL